MWKIPEIVFESGNMIHNRMMCDALKVVDS